MSFCRKVLFNCVFCVLYFLLFCLTVYVFLYMFFWLCMLCQLCLGILDMSLGMLSILDLDAVAGGTAVLWQMSNIPTCLV